MEGFIVSEVTYPDLISDKLKSLKDYDKLTNLLARAEVLKTEIDKLKERVKE